MIWHWNEWMFGILFRLAHQSEVGDWIVIFFSSILPGIVTILVLWHVLRIADIRMRFREAIVTLTPAIVAYGMSEFVKWVFMFPRPFAYAADIAPLIQVADPFGSFPSSHTIFFAALGGALFLHGRRWGEWIIFSAALFGLARVVAGVHWPLDILTGFILGLIIAQVCFELEKSVGMTLPGK